MIGGRINTKRGAVNIVQNKTDRVKTISNFIALCLICKNEPIDRVLNTISYYKSIGFDNILFYDGSENALLHTSLINHINRGTVIYHKCIDIKDNVKQNVFKNCYETYKNRFEWIAFFDVDEKLILNKHKDIKTYLSQSKFADCNIIQIDRKTKIISDEKTIASYNNNYVKCILHCNGPYIIDTKYKYITNTLCKQDKYIFVNGNGENVNGDGKCNDAFEEVYIEHTHSSSFTDFLLKLKNGNPKENRFNSVCLSYIEMKLRGYFKYVEFTNEHLNQINSIFPDFGITKESIFNEIDLSVKTDIDYVFPYVDDTDAEWYNEYKKHKGDVDYENDTVAGAARYKTYGLLRYKLRSIEQNMPWVRNIYMIVSSKSQVPKWLNTTKIKIVYHKDIIPEKFLPTFNSSTIEMFLGNIEGLSEKFLYGNDDFYILKPIMPYMFFRNNKPLLYLKERNIDKRGKLSVNYIADAFIKNDIDIAKTGTKHKDIEKLFQPDHHIKPMLKSKIKEVVDSNKEVIYSGCTRFRDFNNFNQYLYHYYNVFNDNYISYHRDSCFFVYKGSCERLPDIIDKYSLVSVDFDTVMNNQRTIDNIFCNKLPNKCKYEKDKGEKSYYNRIRMTYIRNSEKLFKLMGGSEMQPYPAIHIVGTDGKGSTTSMIASILIESGYNVGIFRSPKVRTERDEICVNNKIIPVADFERLKEEVLSFINNNDIIPNVEGTPKISWGTVNFIISLLYFKEKNVDISIYEATLGCLTCPTIFINPIVSILTNIDNEQTQYFNNDILKLAEDKSHVIRPNIPAFIGETPKDYRVKDIVFNMVKECNVPLIVCDDKNKNNNFIVNYLGEGKYETKLGDFELELGGDYQYQNLNLVLHTIQELRKQGWNITNEHIKNGLKNVSKNTRFCGRWQILNESPKVIYDSCHTPFAWEKVIKQLKGMKYNKLNIVFQICRDKDVDAIVSNFIDDENVSYYFPYHENKPRFMHPDILIKKTEWLRKSKCYCIGSFTETMKDVISKSKVNDVIFIGGTTYVVRAANKIFKEKMITNLGGKCFGHFMIKNIHKYTDKFTPLYCPFGAMRFNNGFSDAYKVFNGTFYAELFNTPNELKKDELSRRDGVSIEYFYTKTLRIMHANMNSEKDIKKLKNRHKLFFNTLSKTNNIIFLYSLCEFDVDKTVEEIKEACDKLKKYIDIDRLYIIGSIANKNKKSSWWFDYQNSNFKEVFGERYIEIEGANAGNMENCTKKLIKKLNL